MSTRDPHHQPNDEPEQRDRRDRRDKDSPMSDETSERRVREVLSSVNDLEPPRDDLFVARAITKGRARTSRRRSAQFGAAAVVLIAGGFGGTWLLGQSSGSTASSLAVDAPAAASGAAAGTGEGASSVAPSSERAAPGRGTPSTVPPLGAGRGTPDARGKADDRSSSARDTSRWLQGPMTAQRIAFDALAPTLAARWPGVFSGAYAADPGNTRIVVALVRPDPALEALVREAMPSPSDVQFVAATNSLAAKQKVAGSIREADGDLRSAGVQVTGIRLDGRTDRVIVSTTPASTPGVLEERYGATIVTAKVVSVTPPVKLPNGSTLPTLQR